MRSGLEFSEELLQRKDEDPTYDASSAEFLVLGEATCGDVIDLQYVNAYDGALGVDKAYVRAHKGPVGVLATTGVATEGVKFCSGTLVGTNLFLTASHCVDAHAVERFVGMNYEYYRGDETALNEVKFYPVREVVWDDPGRDTALLRLGGDPGAEFGWADIRETPVAVGEMTAIIQHPLGDPKQIEAGKISGVSRGRLSYDDTDTQPGSSGAGVLDAEGLLVGVHTDPGCTLQGGANEGRLIARSLAASPVLREVSRGIHWKAGTHWCGHAGARLFTGDFDGDGQDDLLCHDRAGTMWVTLADESGQFTGTTWRGRLGWCGHEGAEAFVGDFDGDGRDDTLCHDSGGDTWVALANEAGEFTGTSWQSSQPWCRHEGARLFIGDFDGNGRDDMLCHDQAGNKDLAFSDPTGSFTGGSTLVPMRWCMHEGAELFVGDFDGDGRDDLLCHDRAGDTRVALAGPEGELSGEGWHSPMGWCDHEGAELFVGDFDGDGRDDMLCHDRAGDTRVTLADPSGRFVGTEWHAQMKWCDRAGDELHIGSFNTDGRADMLCHDPSGAMWISNARPDGSF
ncbi:trypsin-like serine peptidase [Nannocystis pusilla]|uniref:trypsin-like serine peptidase n=1 Tax=Nannocystis pusilla TaxID=889268 RepID=UPI003DA3AB95